MVLAEVLSGIVEPAHPKTVSSSGKVKITKTKKATKKTVTTQGEDAIVHGTSSSSGGQLSAVQGSRRNVTNSVGTVVLPTPAPHTSSAGSVSNLPGNGVTAGAVKASEVKATEGTSAHLQDTEGEEVPEFQDPVEAEGVYDPSQHWMWHPQFQPFAMNPYAQYGNFVPNFGFGHVPTPDWTLPDPALGERSQQGLPLSRHVHAISEDEEEEGSGGEDTSQDPQSPPPQLQPAATKPPPPGGNLAEMVKDQNAQVKEGDKVSAPLDQEVASLLDRYLADAQLVSDLEKLAKAHPRVANVINMRVPRLDSEVFQALDQGPRSTDQAFQTIQKGIMSAMSAFAPLLDIASKRGDNDKELDDLGGNLLEAFQLLAHSHNALSTRRREALKPHLSPLYAKAMSKGQLSNQEWLYGGDLAETTKTCETAKKIAEKVLKRKPLPPQGRRGMGQKRFRPAQGGLPPTFFRGFNPYQVQQVRFNAPSTFPQFPQPGFMFPQGNNAFNPNFIRRGRFQGPRPKQGFAKRGAYTK